MNIVMVLAGRDFPPDIRVEKECRALLDGGHEVTVVCDRKSDRPLEDEWRGVRIVRMPRPSPFIAPIVKAVELIGHRSWRWEATLKRIIRERAIDVLHVHDLPMVGTALKCSRVQGIPVIADLHENYPAMVRVPRDAEAPIWKLRLRLLRFLDRLARWERFEKRIVPKVDHVLVVVEEAKARLKRMGVPEKQLTVIRNTVDVEHIEGIPLKSDIVDAFGDDFVISYIGGFTGRHRGLETVVRAMPTVLTECPQARLLFVGRGPMEEGLRRQAKFLGIGSRVTFVGWQPFEAVPSYIQRSQVCLVPHESFEHTETTMPHKIFQYMAMGKPVVVSSCRPLQRIVEVTDAGLVFEAGDEESLACALIALLDPELRERLGKAGRIATRQEFNWSKDAFELRTVYETIAEN